MKRLLISICLIFCACSEQQLEPLQILPPDITLNPYTAQTIANKETHYNELHSLGNKNVQHFKALPNEALCLQIFAPLHHLQRIQLSLSGITAKVTCYRIGLIKNTEKSNAFYPDILVPLKADSAVLGDSNASLSAVSFDKTSFSAATSNFPVPNGTQLEGAWLEIIIPPGTTAGSFTGELIIETSAIKKLMPLSVEVLKGPASRLPFQLDMNEYGYKYHRAAPKDTLPEQRKRLDQKAHQFARDHYAVLNPLPYRSQRGIPYQTTIPVLQNKDLLNPQLDWQAFDERFGALYDGSAFSDGNPVRHAYLPFNPEWPAPLTLYFSDQQKYEKIWQAFADAYIAHFQERGWTKTIFQVYSNQKPGENNRIPWNLDEPKSIEDYRALRYYQQLTNRVFSQSDSIDIRFRLDISHFFCDEHTGYEDRDLRINNGMPLLEDIEIWAIAGHSIGDSLADKKAQSLLQSGKEVWLYGATPYLHTPANDIFALTFQTRQSGLTGFMFWKSLGRVRYPNGGFDHIFHVGKSEEFNKTTFYPTIRLKQLRRAMDDLRHIALQPGLTVDKMHAVFKSGERDSIRQATAAWR